MVGRIEACLLFAYRIPIGRAADCLPRPLEPLTYGGFAYANVVVSRLSRMRPASLPAWCGVSYSHVAVRLYARYGSTVGLVFLRSDADVPGLASRPFLAVAQATTSFHIHPAQVEFEGRNVEVRSSGGALKAKELCGLPSLAPGSPFSSLNEAESFLKYPPRALTVQGGDVSPRVSVLQIERDESAWKARPYAASVDCEFLRGWNAELELATEVGPIDYRWNRSRMLGIAPEGETG